MIFFEYPITGPLRRHLLVMEWIFIFLSFELAFIFLIKYKKSLKTIKNSEELSYSILFFTYGLQWFWFVMSDFYAQNSEMRMIFLIIGYFTLMIGAFIFIIVTEKHNIFFKKYLFSSFFLITFTIFIVFTIIDIKYAPNLSYLTTFIFVPFFISYLVKLAKKSSLKGGVIVNFIKLISGYILLIIGYMLATDVVAQNFGLESRLWGDIIQIISLFIIYFLYTSLPPLSEYDWYEKIKSVFLVKNSGLCFYSKNFQEEEKNLEQSLKIAGLTGIEMILESLTYDKGLSVLKKQNYSIIIYPSKNIIGILFCTQELSSLKELLKSFVSRIEAVYASVLSGWKGNLRIFEPIDLICEEIFKKL